MTLIYESAPELDETITIDPDIEDLHYDRTVDRHKVHRAAVSEVFLTDIRRQSAQHVLVAAQLPSSHSFFHDSIYNDAKGTPDALLLLEIARQATIASAHEVGVDAGNTLISNEFGLTIYPHEIAALNPEDTNLLIRNYFDWTSIRRGAPRSGRCYQQLIMGNRVIAEQVLVNGTEGEGLDELGDDDHHIDNAHVDASALLADHLNGHDVGHARNRSPGHTNADHGQGEGRGGGQF